VKRFLRGRRLHGKDRVKFLEKIVVSDVTALRDHQAQLSSFPNEKGGTIDDCMVTKRENYLGIVLNAGCKEKDMAHIRKHIAESKLDVQLEYLEDRPLLALQGPKAAAVLSRLLPSSVDLSKWPFMTDGDVVVAGFPCGVTRCGYTGEDGFEISVDHKHAAALWNRLLEEKEVLPAGLGVRDSLRLEAGLCLYGHELDETISPIEAGLTWTISKRRREQGGFLGADVILKQIREGVTRKRVGLLVTGAPAREGAEIVDPAGKRVGTVTSGTFSPSLKRPIAMGYVEAAHAKDGTKLQTIVRGKPGEAAVSKLPFVPTNYFKMAK
jgi:aminomethyltransferase